MSYPLYDWPQIHHWIQLIHVVQANCEVLLGQDLEM